MKYLHLFDTQSDFESAYNGEDYGEPWVGLVKANGKGRGDDEWHPGSYFG